MDYKVELKPFVRKDGVKYKVIQITDVALHTTRKTPTPLVGKKIQDALEKNKPDRIYSHMEKPVISDNRTFTINMLKTDSDFMRMVQEEEAKGYKVLISLPKEGIPVVLGKDTVEFINSKNGKRILRGLAKEKEEK
jgi:hypothetical protein